MRIEQISPHFTRAELECPHCHECRVQWKLVEILEELRLRLQQPDKPEVPLYVESAYRCYAHNLSVGGSATSQHLNGAAADVWIPGKTSRELYELAKLIEGVGGLGVGDTRKTLHVDIRPVVVFAKWCYDAAGKTVPWHEA